MLDNIHAHWKRRRVCKIKCKGVCTVDMDNVRQQLEEKTGGKVIYSKGGLIYLFRGRNYNYRTRPRYPLMLWKPITPVYPRLVQHAPEGLTLEEATEMRKKGRQLPPICKLGKNGVYNNLVKNVKEAFEACELVRIDCTGLVRSDCRKIGAKLKDLVPCVLVSFEYEHILIWRGEHWKSSLPPQEDVQNKAVELVADDSSSTTSSSIADLEGQASLELHAERSLKKEVISLTPNENMAESKGVGAEEEMDLSKERVEPVADNAVSIQEEAPDPITEKNSHEYLHSISLGEASTLPVTDLSHVVPCIDPTRSSHIGTVEEFKLMVTDSQSCGDDDIGSDVACLDGVMLLLRQAVESGSALILDDEPLDANMVYERSVGLARKAPSGPVFQHRTRRVAVQKTKKEESESPGEQDVEVEAITPVKRTNENKMSRGRKREDLREVIPDVVPRGSLRVDELAKLLA